MYQIHEKSRLKYNTRSQFLDLNYACNKYNIAELVSQTSGYLKVLPIFFLWPVCFAVSFVSRRFPSRDNLKAKDDL